MGFNYARPEILSVCFLCTRLLSLLFDLGPWAGCGKIRMKHPYSLTLSLYAMELGVPRARWDAHKLNSIENSIWDQTFPGANSAGIIMYKKTHSTFQPEQSRLQRPPPWKWKSFWGKPQGSVSRRVSTLTNFPWMLSDGCKMSAGRNKSRRSLTLGQQLEVESHFTSPVHL